MSAMILFQTFGALASRCIPEVTYLSQAALRGSMAQLRFFEILFLLKQKQSFAYVLILIIRGHRHDCIGNRRK